MSNFIQSNAVITLLAPSATAQTMSVADSGKIIVIPAATANGVVNLPAVAPGLCYKFIMAATAAFTVTLTPTANGLVNGSVLNNNAAAGEVVSKNAANTTNFTATAVAGDWIEVVSDGTNWYVFGQSRVAAGLA